MRAQVSSPRSQAASPAALGFIGLGFVLSGILLLWLAFSDAAFGRLVTWAWAVGVAGLAFLIPGAIAASYGLFRGLKARRQNGRNSAGGKS